MLSIVICEDDWKQRQTIEIYIKNYVMIEELAIETVFSSGNPLEIIDYVKSQPKMTGIYFLDIDLGHEMTGLALAAEIRKYDTLGKIIFVTTHSEMTYLTFTYKVEAMDYLIKDSPENLQKRVCESIYLAIKRIYQDTTENKRFFKLKDGDVLRSINLDDIIFFESSGTQKKVIVHLENEEYEFYGNLTEINKENSMFYRSHKSYLINPNHIIKVNKSDRVAEMSNGEICLVSVRAMKNII